MGTILGDFGDPKKQAAAGAFGYVLLSSGSGVSQSFQIKVGEGILHTITCQNDIGAVRVFDNASADSGVLAFLDTDAGTALPLVNVLFDCVFANGLRISVDGGSAGAGGDIAARQITVTYL